jgi:TIR domain
VAGTDGATASFMRELVGRAVLRQLDAIPADQQVSLDESGAPDRARRAVRRAAGTDSQPARRGGDDWTAILEERLTSCCALLLFVSQEAIDSEYVRREVLFADSIDKRIVSVRLEAARLRHGMGLFLPRYQMIDQRVDDFLEQLAKALNHVR